MLCFDSVPAHGLAPRGPVRRLLRLFHDDIECGQEGEDDGEEVDRQGRDVDGGAVGEAR